MGSTGTDGARRMLAGRYELLEVLGRGGMGVVYSATDVVLDRTVAVKVLPAALAEEHPTHVERFEREARAVASVNHPGVVAVYDTGAEEATRFIVMECAAGRSLAGILRSDGRLEPERAADIAGRVADALASAHAAGLIHRDVKPSNVMVAADGSVKVLDFGIARMLDATTLTRDAAVLGSAPYMAPEQARGERADMRSDIYSLGCLLYEMLTGRPPFAGEAAAAVLQQHLAAAPRPPSETNPGVEPALDALVLEMLAKAPGDRPESATQVSERLAALPATAATMPGPAPETVAEPTAVTRMRDAITRVLDAAPGMRDTEPRMPDSAPRDRHRRLLAATAVVALAVLVAIIVVLAGGGSSPRPQGSAGADSAKAHTAGARASAPGAATGSSTPTAKPSTATASTSTGTSTGAPGQAVAAAAAAISALISRDAESAQIDRRAAQQITNRLGDVLRAFGAGSTTEAQHKLADLQRAVASLEGHADISPAAAPALNAGLARLTAALAASTPTPPATVEGEASAPLSGPTHKAGKVRGQDKKHARSHEDQHGD
ncbi:MAG TPA: protein kinase [Solirubrobacteraceae bacterium]|nr:protein kinase [Solirubrobacteraceae bacterium]